MGGPTSDQITRNATVPHTVRRRPRRGLESFEYLNAISNGTRKTDMAISLRMRHSPQSRFVDVWARSIEPEGQAPQMIEIRADEANANPTIVEGNMWVRLKAAISP